MREFKKAIGLMVFALSSISAQSFEAAFPHSGVPELSQMARPDPQGVLPTPKDALPREERVKRGIIGMTIAGDGSFIVVAASSYIAIGIKIFRCLNVLGGIGKFSVMSWGGVVEYNYSMIGAKARLPLSFWALESFPKGGFLFYQFGVEYGWSLKESSGGAINFGIGYESPIFFRFISFDCSAQIKVGNEPICSWGALGIGLGTTWYFK